MNIHRTTKKQIFDFVNYDMKTHILRVRIGQEFRDFKFIEGEDRCQLEHLIKNNEIRIDDEISIMATKRKNKAYGNYVVTHLLSYKKGKQLNLENFL